MSKTRSKLWTAANVVTVARICFVPVFIIAILAPWPAMFGNHPYIEALKPWVAAAIFGILAATDSVDGYLARSRNEVTTFGKFIDPIADKILTASALIALVELQIVPSWIVIVILCREFIVSGLRMIAATEGTVIAASWYGKAKTVFQIIAILLFILKDSLVSLLPAQLQTPMVWFAWLIMLIALFLTILSMIDYLSKARELLGFTTRDDDEAETGDGLAEGTTENEGESAFTHNGDLSSYLPSAERVIASYARKGKRIATAESLTGGMIASALTAIPGSSEVLCGGLVTYTDAMKHDLLGVDTELLERYGAVSEEVACSMAVGALQRTNADVAVSVTGIAGPTGSEPDKPIGTVWLGVCHAGSPSTAKRYIFSGDRAAVRRQTVQAALEALETAQL